MISPPFSQDGIDLCHSNYPRQLHKSIKSKRHFFSLNLARVHAKLARHRSQSIFPFPFFPTNSGATPLTRKC